MSKAVLCQVKAPHGQTGVPGNFFGRHRHCYKTVAAVQIDFPVGDLGGFSCAEAEVRFSYKYKNLRTALTNIPQKDATGVNSKVRLCASFIHCFIHAFFVGPCIYPFINSFIHSLMHQRMHPSYTRIYSSMHSFIHSRTHSLKNSLTQSLTHSLIRRCPSDCSEASCWGQR